MDLSIYHTLSAFSFNMLNGWEVFYIYLHLMSGHGAFFAPNVFGESVASFVLQLCIIREIGSSVMIDYNEGHCLKFISYL